MRRSSTSAHETDHSFTSAGVACDVWIGVGRRARGFWLRDADQERLVLGKSYYGYAPLGPWMVTADEVPNPQEVDLWLEVNGMRRQPGNTRTQLLSQRDEERRDESGE